MSTTIKKTKTPKVATRKSTASFKGTQNQKPSQRIRPDLLPDSAVYGTFAGREYVMIPVDDFGEWYEDITLGAVAQDRMDNDTEPPIPLEAILAEMNSPNKRKSGR